jgi:hypothetical protein
MLRMLRKADRDRTRYPRCTLTRGTYPDLTPTADIPCSVSPMPSGTTGEVQSGGTAMVLNFYRVLLPYDLDVRRGDVLTITRSRDPRMVGRWLTVREATIDEDLTSRIVICEESVS